MIEDIEKESCAHCNEEFPEEEMEQLVDSDGYASYVCQKCWKESTGDGE